MSSNKNFVDINNLSQFWTNTKNYIDNTISLTTLKTIDYSIDSNMTFAIYPNHIYYMGLRRSLTIFLQETGKYYFQFTSGFYPTTLTLVGDVEWNNNICPKFDKYTKYTISIENGVASIIDSESLINKYLTFEALEDGTFSFSRNNIDYSLDGGSTWTTLTAGSSTPTISAGSKVMWRINNPTISSNGIGTFSSTGKFSVEGNIMSLLCGDDFKDIDYNYLVGKTGVMMNLFSRCMKLIDAHNLILPTTTLANYCYSSMFHYCTSLTTAPELPANTLANYCYCNMFQNCTSLTTAPELPATTLAPFCYDSMFKYCSKLNNITMLATNISVSGGLYDWVNGVASTGAFTKVSSMTSLPTGNSGIPSGWDVYVNLSGIINSPYSDYSKRYLTFEAIENGSFSFYKRGGIGNIQYSLDCGTTWEILEDLHNVYLTAGQEIWWKGNLINTILDNHSLNYIDNMPNIGIGRFISSGKYNAKGNVMSLLYEDDFIGKTDLVGQATFAFLFAGLTNLPNNKNIINDFLEGSRISNISYLFFPAKQIIPYGYYNTFYMCEYLNGAPYILATKLSYYCCYHMFHGCTSLTTSPKLYSKILIPYCYEGMFTDCPNLSSITIFATDVSLDMNFGNNYTTEELIGMALTQIVDDNVSGRIYLNRNSNINNYIINSFPNWTTSTHNGDIDTESHKQYYDGIIKII